MAFAATRRVGTSVDRHRAVRKLREFYRLNKDLVPQGTRLLLVLRRPVPDWRVFEARLARLFAELPAEPKP